MDKLIQFFKQFNTHEFILPQSTEVKNELLESMTDLYRSALVKNYLNEDVYESGVFGCSQMGKPAIITAWDYYYNTNYPKPTFAQKRKWFEGHLFETNVFYYLHRLGYEVQHQVDIEINEYIKGHPDFLVTDPQTQRRFVVECKHVDDTRYKHYLKYGMDSQQYQTQLGLYCSALKCDGAWVIGNACTGEIMVIPVIYEQILKLYGDLMIRSFWITGVCKSSDSLVEVLKKGLEPPKPRRRKDGTFYIPPELYMKKKVLHPACAIYDFYEKDDKYYVVGLNYPEEARGYEPDWLGELKQ